MRVTQRNVTRNYINNLNKNVGNLSNSNAKLSSLRRFSKVSEDTAAALKAFDIREKIYKDEQFLRNISDVRNELSTAEDSLLTINNILSTVKERMIQGKTGTVPEDARGIIAFEIRKLKEQVLTTMNTKFGDKFVFSGSNNATPPFAADSQGRLTYNGVLVSNIEKDPKTGLLSISDKGNPPVFTPVPQNKDVYIDLGLGLKIEDGNVDKTSAFKVSISGLDVSGYGQKEVDGVSIPGNIYDFLNTVEKAFANNDMKDMDTFLGEFDKMTSQFVVNITEIGSRSTFIDQTATRVENEIFNLTSSQNDLESLDIAKETIYNKSYEMAWQVSLQVGSKIIPPSIFDFMR